MKKVLRIGLLIVFLGLFLGTLVFIYRKSQKEDVVYKIHQPFRTDIVQKIVATGTIVPEKEVDITPKISGVLQEIFVEPGDEVKKGDVIAKIQVVPNMVNLNSAESRVRKSEISLDDATREYERNKPLLEAEIITEVEFNQFKLAYSNAIEELRAAKDNLLLIRNGVTRGTESRTNTLIRSTIDGMVLDIPLKEGSSVIESNNFNNGTVVAQVADIRKMIFEGVVDESDVNKLKAGMPIRLTIGAIEGKVFDAVITYIAPKGKEEQGAVQFDVKATVSLREDAFIRVGYSANADIIIEEKKNVLAINEGLLQFDDNGSFVELETDKEQKFEKVYVETGLSDGINVQIVKGLGEDAMVKQWDLETTYNTNGK